MDKEIIYLNTKIVWRKYNNICFLVECRNTLQLFNLGTLSFQLSTLSISKDKESFILIFKAVNEIMAMILLYTLGSKCAWRKKMLYIAWLFAFYDLFNFGGRLGLG
ncbi:hypothetical protein EDEG_03766 [Edhazardia aedis USNM 41457]|uniref:Uncharacterized protein n=1 Tax=Edhazardia aedis (strain USNM 41457) TaxID=1003232 RepID=J9D2A1_EDHAE|nr:hypothetical protein EDEG_03766 [Edhazardia aedis USNM 41457]|eukprot:EJW01704.1 hypothetical protein EDEG_03766 [Edhazardia aedis USNM 41457]